MNAQPRTAIPHAKLRIAGLFIALTLLVVAFRVPILQLSAVPLISTDNGHLQKAEAILILGGGLDTRPFEAARLYKAGMAPLLLLANEEPGPVAELGLGRSGCEITLDILTMIEQIPPENIVLIGTAGSASLSEMGAFADGASNPRAKLSSAEKIGYVTSTFDEANALKKWCEAQRASSVIMVTNPFYSQRVRSIFHKVLEQRTTNGAPGTKVTIQLATIDCRNYTPFDWWRSEAGLIAFNNEWIKTAYYWLKY